MKNANEKKEILDNRPLASKELDIGIGYITAVKKIWGNNPPANLPCGKEAKRKLLEMAVEQHKKGG